jgi:hypothetical protein
VTIGPSLGTLEQFLEKTMHTQKAKEQNVVVNIDSSELKAHQVRLIKTVNSLISTLMTTDNEEEFFETTSELVKMVASAVKRSNFSEEFCKGEKIPYAEQALEFALDHLNDEIHNGDFLRFDN